MFQSFRVRNFRCFSDLQVENLARVNLIAGKNNVGKTSFLEALFLHLGPDNPELSMRLNALRGIPWFGSIPEETWGWLFLNKNAELTIELTTTSDTGQRDLRIRLAESESTQIPAPSNGGASPGKESGSATTGAGARDLVLEYREGEAEPVVSHASLVVEEEELKVKFKRRANRGLPLGVFLTSAAYDAPENARRFSKLQEVGKEESVLSALQAVEPRLQRLLVSAMGPGIPVIQCDVGIGRRVPLPLAGGGMNRLLSHLLAIAEAKKGTVLIDEIENGLHYSVLHKVWQAIGEFAEQYGTQVFASTHSCECMRAAHKVFRVAAPSAFAYHRLERVGEDIEAVTMTPEMLATADEAGLEVR